MQKRLPPASSRNTSMLGVAHLFRLYWKLILGKLNLLSTGYDLGQGFDAMTFKALGIDPGAAIAFADTLPSPERFGEWIRKNATNISPNAIAGHNLAIFGHQHTKEYRDIILKFCGVVDGPNVPWDAVTLNEVEDAHFEWLNLLSMPNSVFLEPISAAEEAS